MSAGAEPVPRGFAMPRPGPPAGEGPADGADPADGTVLAGAADPVGGTVLADGADPADGTVLAGAADPVGGTVLAGGADPAGLEPLAPDDTVDLAAQEQALRISQLLGRLDAEFIGLAPVKDRVREIAALLLIDRLRGRYGLTSSRPSLHMCFTGSPGTGKTTVATHMGELLRELGYLRKGQLVSVTRDDLVGQYVGHTAPKTKEVLKRAMGGVLLIDEAYYLYRPENERDYGQESIEILLQFMEAHREDLVVILAGYADRMDTFFRSNPGMASRIAHHIDFPDFTLDELLQIAEKMLERGQYRLSPAAGEAFAEYVRLRMSQPRFANARSIRNAIDRLRLRQARRLVAAGGVLARGDLMEISAEDVRASRVFRDAARAGGARGGLAGEAARAAPSQPAHPGLS
ncbi:MAG TPA: CbbX protein [Streptosporangiaceae bacterium]|nr:CbbX protein [Streptosporangiaceae bacterium]